MPSLQAPFWFVGPTAVGRRVGPIHIGDGLIGPSHGLALYELRLEAQVPSTLGGLLVDVAALGREKQRVLSGCNLEAPPPLESPPAPAPASGAPPVAPLPPVPTGAPALPLPALLLPAGAWPAEPLAPASAPPSAAENG